jgi:isoquinoline 1-oxidoreductase beta subunit
MLTAMVAHPPRFGATVASFDATAAKKVPGVVEVYQIPTGVAVVADNTWAARQGRDALVVKWDESQGREARLRRHPGRYKDIAAGKSPAHAKAGWQPFDQGRRRPGGRRRPAVETPTTSRSWRTPRWSR